MSDALAPWPLVIGGAMDGSTCRRVRASMDAGEVEDAEVLEAAPEPERIGEARADVRRARYVDVPEEVLDVVGDRLDAQRQAIEAFFGCALAGREGPGLIRYETGGFYRRHVDRTDTPSWPGAARRAVTVILFLASAREADPSGAFSGGALRLHLQGADAPVEIVPVQGTLVAFPADTPHEVMPVTDGRRDAAVDWFYDA